MMTTLSGKSFPVYGPDLTPDFPVLASRCFPALVQGRVLFHAIRGRKPLMHGGSINWWYLGSSIDKVGNGICKLRPASVSELVLVRMTPGSGSVEPSELFPSALSPTNSRSSSLISIIYFLSHSCLTLTLRLPRPPTSPPTSK